MSFWRKPFQVSRIISPQSSIKIRKNVLHQIIHTKISPQKNKLSFDFTLTKIVFIKNVWCKRCKKRAFEVPVVVFVNKYFWSFSNLVDYIF